MEWISVKEKEPKDFEDVLFTEGQVVFIGFRFCLDDGDDGRDDFYYYSRERNIRGVTHWMPLPELPTLDRKIYYEKNDVAG